MKYSASTDDTGRYALPSLPVASYDVVVTLGGFKPFRRPALAVAANSTQTVDAALEAGDADSERVALLDRIEELEKRLNDLESSAVLSEPETRVKRVEVYVDKNGVEYDTPQPGAKKTYTYQRERVYRRQTINEKIEEAMADAADKSVRIGVDATTVAQFAGQTHTNDELRGQRGLRAGLRRSLLHRQAGAVHDVLRRRRRAQRCAAGRRDSDADAAEWLHGAPDQSEPAESARGVAADGILRPASRR